MRAWRAAAPPLRRGRSRRYSGYSSVHGTVPGYPHGRRTRLSAMMKDEVIRESPVSKVPARGEMRAISEGVIEPRGVRLRMTLDCQVRHMGEGRRIQRFTTNEPASSSPLLAGLECSIPYQSKRICQVTAENTYTV